jgi:hypothetical protein
MDERGMGLRATWHLDRGIVNISVWRDDRCVETFWLSVTDAGKLVHFLVQGLTEATAQLVSGPTVDASSGGRLASVTGLLRRVARR